MSPELKQRRTKRLNWIADVHYRKIPKTANGDKYVMIHTMAHRGPDGLTKTIPRDTLSNGADLALDLCAEAFFLHDEFCKYPFWDNGKPISNWGASREYRRILRRNGHTARGVIRFYATFLFGGARIKKVNGWLPKRSNK